MTGYELGVVRSACEPSGIPAQCPKFLPTLGEIRAWLQNKAEADAKLEFQESQPRRLPLPRTEKKMPMWNLFVASDIPGYDRVVEISKDRDPAHSKYEENHLCSDGKISDGMWIPWPWWDEIKGRTKSSFSGLGG